MITVEDTFRSYASKVEEIYNNWLKVTAEGTSITLSPTRKGKINVDSLKGNTEQAPNPSPDSPQEIKVATGVNTINVGGTDYTINLGTMELCKIGTYEDYIYKENDKWYLHKATKKSTSENSRWSFSQQTNNVFYSSSLTEGVATESNTPYCTHYKGQSNVHNAGQASAKGNNSIMFKDYDNVTYIIDNRYNTTQAFTEWLSTHPITVYYGIATPIVTEITDTTLISQLELLNTAHSTDNSTTISATGNLPVIIKASALKKGGI